MALEAEHALLGAMLIDERCIPGVLGVVGEDDFETGPARDLFLAIRALFRAGKPVDGVTAAERAGWKDDRERRRYVAEILETTVSSTAATEYAALVHQHGTMRRVHLSAAELTMAHTVDDCRRPLADITETLASGEKLCAMSIGELLTDFGARQMDDSARDYVTLGFQELDDNLFIEPGDVVAIGGAPSDGKTALALQLAWHISKTRSVGFYSLETKAAKLADRLVATGMGLSFGRIKRGKLTQEDWDSYAGQVNDATARRFTVVPAAGMTADQITASSRALGFDVVVIDYGQLVRPKDSRAARHEQLADISMAFHTFAQSSGTLVILLLQLGRKERGSKRESDMFDLAGSAQFERDADTVFTLDRPHKGQRIDPDDKDSDELDPETTRILNVAKQKEGKRVTLALHFDGDKQHFEMLVPDGRAVARRFSRMGREAREQQHRDAARQMGFQELTEQEGEMPF